MLIESGDLRYEINNMIAERENYNMGDTSLVVSGELIAYYTVLDILYDLENRTFKGGSEHIKQQLEDK